MHHHFVLQYASHYLSLFSNYEQSIRTAQYDLHNKICLEIKFYIFLVFFTIFFHKYNITLYDGTKSRDFGS